MSHWSHANLSQIASAPPCATANGQRPVGCVRPDGTSAVLFVGEDGHVHQLHLRAGTWVHTDLSLMTNAPVAEPGGLSDSWASVCVRPDNVFSIAYRGRDNHIHALQIQDDRGSHVDLSVSSGVSSRAVGPPTHFVRGDGVATIVYAEEGGTSGDHVAQLHLSGENWVHSNLSELTQTQSPLVIAPAGYVKSDHVTAVVFTDIEPGLQTRGIIEMALPQNGNWTSKNLFSSSSTPLPDPRRWLMGFIRADGAPAVLYAGFDRGVHELAFVGDRWVGSALSQLANAPKMKDILLEGPVGYVRGDGTTAVVYSGSDDHIHELTAVGHTWTHSDLFSLAPATGTLADGTPTASYPFAYVRSDRVSSILWIAPDKQIHELALLPA
jgi:hypothetical protein